MTVTAMGLPSATVSYIPGKRTEHGAALTEFGAASFCILAAGFLGEDVECMVSGCEPRSYLLKGTEV